VHSGWPTTDLVLVGDGTDASGEPIYRAVPGPRNARRYETFASLDLRIARTWQLPRGSLVAFLEIANLTDRRNPCCRDFDLDESEDGAPLLDGDVNYWLPRLPAIGVRWQF
jgi:hypothetical protein